MSAVHSSAAAGSIAHKQTQPRRAQLPAVRLPRRAAPAAWRVAAKKQGSAKKQDSKLQVPDSPPSRGAEEPAEEPAAAAASTSEAAAAPAEPQEVGGRMTAEEIQRQMGELRAAAKEEAKKDGLIEGVLEEVRLIKWPTPQSALLNTLLVIAIVAGTSALLFGVNALLSEVTQAVYHKS